MNRREFIQSFGAGVLPFANRNKQQSRIEIGVYITKTARDKHGSKYANLLAGTLSDIYRRQFGNYELYIGPESVIKVPGKAEQNEMAALQWWREYEPEYAHSNILLFSSKQTNWDRSGLGYINYSYAVATGAELLHWRRIKHLAVHETSHNLGLRHDDGEIKNGEASIMQPRPWRNKNRIGLEYSTDSIAQITDRV